MVEGMSVREASRQRGHRGTRRCALRERRRENGPAQPAAQLRRPNPAPAGHQRILCPRGQVRHAVLPARGRRRGGGHPGAVDLRPADQPALHPEGQSPAEPPHHSKQHGEKPRLPEPNFIKPRGFQDDRFFPHLQQLQTDARAVNVANFATADYGCAAQSNTPAMAQSSTSSSDMPSNSRST